jgi:hypothetical protein
MKILGLPGRDAATEAWLWELLGAIGGGKHDGSVPVYRHWYVDQPPDPIYEAAQLSVTGVDLVVAKSMGTMVLLEMVKRGFAPGAAVLIGVPLIGYSEAQRLELKSLVAQLRCLCIQQTDDLTGSFHQLAEVVGEGGATLREVPGSDHVYPDTRQLATLITAWLD